VDAHADVDHHRAVLTFLGSSSVVETAALALCRRAVVAIDLRHHTGVHPRIGAVDVVPFIPMRGARMADAVAAAHRLGASLARELAVPVYYYGAAALVPERRELSAVRRGQFEGLTARMATAEARPDVGPSTPHPWAGATAVGARPVLIAFNATLASADRTVARDVARVLRAAGGGLPGVQALGVPLASRDRVQVTLNLLDYRRTGIASVMAAVEAAAARRGVTVEEYELVGCAPADALAGADRRRIRMSETQLLDLELFSPDALGADAGTPT
jgi:glutamate formiminotransferase